MWLLREMADELVVVKLTGPVTLGLYSVAREVALLPANKLAGVSNMLSSPIMAELQGDVDAMRAAFYRALRVTAAIAVPTAAGMALVADEIVASLLGPKWLPTISMLRLLCLYSAVRAIDVMLPPVLVARRRERFLFWYCLALVIVVPAAAVLGALSYGLAGIVIAWTTVYCAVMTIMANEALAELKGGFFDLWVHSWPILGATAVMTMVVLLLRELGLAGPTDSPWLGLIILSLSGAATYSAALFAIGSPVVSECLEIAAWLLGRDSALVGSTATESARVG